MRQPLQRDREYARRMQCAIETNENIKNKNIAILINKLCTSIVRASLFNDAQRTQRKRCKSIGFLSLKPQIQSFRRNQERAHLKRMSTCLMKRCLMFSVFTVRSSIHNESYASLSQLLFLLSPALWFHVCFFFEWNIENFHRLLNWNNEVNNEVSCGCCCCLDLICSRRSTNLN